MKNITHVGFRIMNDEFTLGISMTNNEWAFAISFLCFEMALFKEVEK